MGDEIDCVLCTGLKKVLKDHVGGFEHKSIDLSKTLCFMVKFQGRHSHFYLPIGLCTSLYSEMMHDNSIAGNCTGYSTSATG